MYKHDVLRKCIHNNKNNSKRQSRIFFLFTHTHTITKFSHILKKEENAKLNFITAVSSKNKRSEKIITFKSYTSVNDIIIIIIASLCHGSSQWLLLSLLQGIIEKISLIYCSDAKHTFFSVHVMFRLFSLLNFMCTHITFSLK